MKHFDKNQWALYSRNSLDEHTKGEMEAHLYGCDTCLNFYLSAVEETEMQNAGTLISPMFGDKVIEQVEIECKKQPAPASLQNPPNIFIFYTAAACITLFFTFSGAFQSLSDAIPHAASQIASSPIQVEQIFTSGWTDRLTNKAVILMDQFKP